MKLKEMTKKELVEVLRGKVEGVAKKDIEAVVNEVFDTVKEKVTKGEKVAIAGFGTFEAVERAGRSGVSKLGGVEKAWTTEAHKAVKFSAGKNFKDAVK